MELLLPFQVTPSSHKISYTDKIVFIGSCFTEEIGKMMKDLKFDILQNPNGILYDPLSIALHWILTLKANNIKRMIFFY